MTHWNKIIQLIKIPSFGLRRYKEIRIHRKGKEDLVFLGRHLGGDTVQGNEGYTLGCHLYAKQTGEIVLEIMEKDTNGTDHAAFEFPNTKEAINYMTKISEDTQKEIKQIKAMNN